MTTHHVHIVLLSKKTLFVTALMGAIFTFPLWGFAAEDPGNVRVKMPNGDVISYENEALWHADPRMGPYGDNYYFDRNLDMYVVKDVRIDPNPMVEGETECPEDPNAAVHC